MAYTMLNNGESTAEILVIELKDTYALNQLRVPWSERDPVNQDPGHFKPVVEDTHARVLQMHLNPREGTVESQFADRNSRSTLTAPCRKMACSFELFLQTIP